VSTRHHVGYSASPHPTSMQHHNELQTAVCGSIVLGHLLSMRVTEMIDGRAACKLTLLEWPLSAATCCAWCSERRWVRWLFPVAWI